MRNIPETLQTYLDSRSTELIHLFEITRVDGTVFRFTDNDGKFVHNGNIYWSETGFSISAVATALYQGFSGGTVTVFYGSGLLNYQVEEIDLRSGAFDKADIIVKVVDRRSPNDSMILYGGVVETVKYDDETVVELQIKSRLFGDRFINVESYSPTCRADLGDDRCKVNINARKLTLSVFEDGARTRSVFTVNKLSLTDEAWTLGSVRFLTGANAGRAFEISSVKDDEVFETASKVTLLYAAPFPIEIGDTLEMWPGCNKSLAMCKNVYNNVLNNRSEPYFANSVDEEKD